LQSFGQRFFPMFVRDDGIELPHIPAGTPIGLIANLDLLALDTPIEQRKGRLKELADLAHQVKDELNAGRDIFANDAVVEKLLKLSKCPDLVVNKGHYFGTDLFTEEPGLNDADKRALIAFIKTF